MILYYLLWPGKCFSLERVLHLSGCGFPGVASPGLHGHVQKKKDYGASFEDGFHFLDERKE